MLTGAARGAKGPEEIGSQFALAFESDQRIDFDLVDNSVKKTMKTKVYGASMIRPVRTNFESFSGNAKSPVREWSERRNGEKKKKKSTTTNTAS